MSNRRKYVRLLAWAMVLVIPACQPREELPETEQSVRVRSAAVIRLPVDESVDATADVLAENRVIIAPEVSGKLTAVSVRRGDKVVLGQVLVRIEDREYRDAVAQAEAALAASEAQLVGAAQTFEVMEAQYLRMKQLWESKSISEGAYDEVRAGYEQARAAHLAARAQVSAFRARLSSARSKLDDCILRAPFDGYVAARMEDPGAIVESMPATSILELVQIDPVRIEAHISGKDFARMAIGMAARVSFDAIPGEEFGGSIAAVSPTLDPSSRTGTIEIRLANPEVRFKPGMAATIHVDIGQMEYLAVPRTALLSTISDRSSEIFLITDGKRAERRKVILKGFKEEWALVVSGVEEGDHLVARGVHAVSDGSRLQIESQSEGSSL